MLKRMLIHDQRLNGNPPRIAQNIYSFPGTTTTHHVASWVGRYAASQRGLDDLIIMCHGYARMNQSTLPGLDSPDGATGLALGTPGLSPENTSLAQLWSGKIRRIVIFACGVAAQSHSSSNPRFDGHRFCGEIALHSGAEVIAADKLQWYNPAHHGFIDFGRWEGRVYSFDGHTGMGIPLPEGFGPHFHRLW